MKRVALCLAIVPLALVSGACNLPGERDPLLGQWNGSWNSGPVTGTLQISFSGRQGFGDMALYSVGTLVTGASCPSGGDRGAGVQAAALLRESLSFAVQIDGGPPGSDEGVFQFEGIVSGGQMSGTYRMVSDACPQCGCGLGASGTWQATR